jgi:hypothetical protein
MPVNVEKLRGVAPSLPRFLEFEREVEGTIRQEHVDRVTDIEDAKRARERRARKKRLRKMRQTQHQ